MPKSWPDRAARALVRTERAKRAALSIVNTILGDMAKNPEQVKADAKLAKVAAPMYLHIASQIAASSVAREAPQDGGPKTTLNVMIMGQAPTNEAWLQAVKDSQVSKAIDAVAVQKTEKT